MTARVSLILGFVILAALGGIGAYMHRIAAPGCDTDRVLDRVSDELRANSHFDSVLLHSVTTQTGGFFSATQECSAQVTEIRGNASISDLPWRAVHYRVARPVRSGPVIVTVALGDQEPLAPEPPSFWQRLWGYLMG